MSLGILVDGNNHFIVHGPLPSPRRARELARRWSLITIGSGVDMTKPEAGSKWRVSTKEFREDLEWAVVAPSEQAHTQAVAALLAELEGRGVVVHRGDDWEGEE